MNVIAFVRLALEVVMGRLLVILALFLSFGLACWVMYEPGWERLATMAFFSIFSYLVINIKERNRDEKPQGSGTQE
jgi:hypothetical protein